MKAEEMLRGREAIEQETKAEEAKAVLTKKIMPAVNIVAFAASFEILRRIFR
jgi:hypothetical protein